MIIIVPLWITAALILAFFPQGNYAVNGSIFIIWCLTIIIFFKKDSKFSMASLLFFIGYTIAALSGFVAEGGSYFSEIKEYSYFTGAVARNLCLCAILLICAYQTNRLLYNLNLISVTMPVYLNSIFKKIILCAVSLSIVILLGIHLRYGSPNDYNVDRFYYWSNIAPEWGGYFKFILIQMAIYLGLFFSSTKNKLYILLFLLSLVAQVLVGEKLTGLYISVIFFVIPVVVNNRISVLRFLFHPKSLMIISMGMIALFLIVLASYNSLAGRGTGLDLFLNRLVLQSQMWWAVDNISNQNLNINEAISHMLGFMSSSDVDTGIYYLMSKIADPVTFYWFYDKGITFTMASPVNFLYFFGPYWSYLFIVPLGVLLGFSIHMLLRSIELMDLVLLFFTLKLFYIMIRVVTMGEVHLIFDYKFAIILLVLLFYMLQVRKRIYHNA